MSCCKAEKYEWCKNLPVVYRDDEGKKYCVFHAPQGKKKISVKGFNRLIFEKLDEAKKSDTECILSGTVFEGTISFDQFVKNSSLLQIIFPRAKSEEANFSEVTFKKVDFSEAIFEKADFSEIIFREANFSKAIFKEVSFLGTTFKEARFFNATFEKAYFLGVFEEADFSEAKFKEANFSATFKSANFSGAKFEKAEFYRAEFSKLADFTELTIAEKIRFEGVNLSTVSFIDTDLTRIDFISCDWAKSHGRNVLYNEICLFRNKEEKTSEDKKTKNILNRFKQGLKQWLYPDRERIKKVEILYRQLKRKCKEDHNDVDISDWHYGEKEMVRKSKRLRKILSLYSLYWLSSGYGERPRRAGIVLICLILSVSVLFGFAGLIPNSEPRLVPINEIKDLVKNPFEVLVNTLQYATFEKDTYFMPQNIWGTFLKILAKLFIPLQAALFAFSVRNRFKR